MWSPQCINGQWICGTSLKKHPHPKNCGPNLMSFQFLTQATWGHQKVLTPPWGNPGYATDHLQPTIYHLQPTNYHLQPSTYNLSRWQIWQHLWCKCYPHQTFNLDDVFSLWRQPHRYPTYHLLPTIYNLPPTTYYLLPTTHNLLQPTTYNLPPKTR